MLSELITAPTHACSHTVCQWQQGLGIVLSARTTCDSSGQVVHSKESPASTPLKVCLLQHNGIA